MDDKWKVKDENPFLKKMDPNKACGDYKWMPYPLKNKSCVVKLFNNNKWKYYIYYSKIEIYIRFEGF